MGTWGTAISSNDTYMDVYEDFFALYNEGFEVTEISKRIIEVNQEITNDPDDSNNFWFALAKAQWECKQLDKQVYERVKKIIETGNDLEVWIRLDATGKDIKKRKIALDKFLSDISIERPKPKSRKKKIIRQPLFEKGDCLTFQFESYSYGGAVVLEAIKDTEHGLNLIALTRINQQQEPSIKDFENSEVLVKSFGAWADSPDIGWYNAKFFNRGNIKIKIAAKVDVEIDYDPTGSSTKFYYGGSDINLIQIPTLQFEFEKTNDRHSKRLTLKEFIKKN